MRVSVFTGPANFYCQELGKQGSGPLNIPLTFQPESVCDLLKPYLPSHHQIGM